MRSQSLAMASAFHRYQRLHVVRRAPERSEWQRRTRWHPSTRSSPSWPKRGGRAAPIAAVDRKDALAARIQESACSSPLRVTLSGAPRREAFFAAMGCLDTIAFFVSLWSRWICGSCGVPRMAVAKGRDASSHARCIAVQQSLESTTGFAGVDACVGSRFLKLVLRAKMTTLGRERVLCSLALALVVLIADMAGHHGIPR
jgi:hypothetical protein